MIQLNLAAFTYLYLQEFGTMLFDYISNLNQLTFRCSKNGKNNDKITGQVISGESIITDPLIQVRKFLFA